MISCYDTFRLLYYSLDSIWEENKDENLGEFCSNMNPFLWKDEGSADPALYSHFKNLFEKKYKNECSYEDAYNFSKDYLKNEVDIYAKYALDAFNKISFEKWLETLKEKINK